MEIAYDLATRGAAKVWLSARTPPNIFLRDGRRGALVNATISTAALLARLPPHGLHPPARLADAVMRLGRRIQLGDLTEFGLPVPEEGMFARLYRDGVSPTIVDEEVIGAIKGGWIEITRGVESLHSSGVRLTDGARVEPDVVICATGYQSGLEPLVGHLAVLDESGLPRSIGRHPAAAGLRFIGYARQLGELGYTGKEARRAAKAIVVELGSPPRRPSRPPGERERSSPAPVTQQK
jgi:hypothetical protein